MAKIPVLTAFLLLLCTLILGQDSPCPEYFTYLIDTLTKEKYGHVQIPAPQNPSRQNNSEYRTILRLSIAADLNQLKQDYMGRMDLAQENNNILLAMQQNRPLFYRVTFPLREPTPLLIGIWINDKEICTGPSAQGAVQTVIHFEHVMLYVPNPNTKSAPPVKVDGDDDCGNITNPNKDVNPFISKGVNILPGQWPWLVAIFVLNLEFDFQCTGNILTNRHVLTAAHCFKLNNEQNINIPLSAMFASFGRYRLRDWYESDSVNREIESYVLHPNYTHQLSADSDLAIFTVKEPVEFSPTIKPICLWSGLSDLGKIISSWGYVVGWGLDNYGNINLAQPRMVTVPIVTQAECHWSDERFATFTSNRTFCAGLRDGSGPCNGDSGSGLVIYNTTTRRYHLRGIVSRSLYNRGEKTCDLSQYVVYVDVTKYKEWIQQQISTG